MPNQLYQQLATVYEAMYQTFIDYEAEYQLYHTILEKYGAKEVLEIGSGTGHLAPKFQSNGMSYIGLDFSADMLQIAQQKHPECAFMQGDMRDFVLAKPIDSAIITARTISYLVSNNDVNNMLNSVKKNLKDGGIFCFDFIDASRFLPAIDPNIAVVHEAKFKGKQYVRESYWKVNATPNWLFDWDATYYEIQNDKRIKLGEDSSTVRTFTLDELLLFLRLNGFEILDTIDRKTYAFDTYVIVARKVGLEQK